MNIELRNHLRRAIELANADPDHDLECGGTYGDIKAALLKVDPAGNAHWVETGEWPNDDDCKLAGGVALDCDGNCDNCSPGNISKRCPGGGSWHGLCEKSAGHEGDCGCLSVE